MGNVPASKINQFCSAEDFNKIWKDLPVDSNHNRFSEKGDLWIPIFPRTQVGENFSKMVNKYGEIFNGDSLRLSVGTSGLTAEHLRVVEEYTGPEFERYNILLLSDSEKLFDPSIASWILHLCNACRWGPLWKQAELPRFTYRTLNLSVEEFQQYEALSGDFFYIQSFMSTTKEKSVACGWRGNTLLRVWLCDFADVFDISGYSKAPQEQEVLLPCYSRFKVLLSQRGPDIDHVGRYFEFYIEVELFSRERPHPSKSLDTSIG